MDEGDGFEPVAPFPPDALSDADSPDAPFDAADEEDDADDPEEAASPPAVEGVPVTALELPFLESVE